MSVTRRLAELPDVEKGIMRTLLFKGAFLGIWTVLMAVAGFGVMGETGNPLFLLLVAPLVLHAVWFVKSLNRAMKASRDYYRNRELHGIA